MSSTAIPASAIPLAEQLLGLVKSIAEPYPGNANGLEVDPLLVWNTRIKIQKVCDRLLVKTMGPLEYTVLLAESCQESQALHFVTSLGIADFIGDGEATLPMLSDKAGVEPLFLGVAMSCLLGRGYFEEVGRFGSRVYKNNELSEILRETHSSTLKHAIGFAGDEGFRATSRLLDAAKIVPASLDQSTSQYKLPAVNIAFGFSNSIFDWMSSPEEAWRGERLGKAMQQFHRMANINISEDYAWHNLASPIVDVGGGIGSLEMALVKHSRNNHLEFIVFDLPKTIDAAEKVWSAQRSSDAARVSLVAGSFMAPTLAESNLPQGKPTYIVSHVLHNWTDKNVVYILNAVRQAMAPNGCLLLVETLLQPESSRFVHATNMQLLALNNGVTRTQEELEVLLKKGGFKMKRMTHMRAVASVIEAVLD